MAHVNQALRGAASDEDEKFVRRLAKTCGFPVKVIDAPIRETSGNLEEMARDARYTAFERMAKASRGRAVLTAHTLDDQAETILMNIFRGTGSSGLAGVPRLRKTAKSELFVGRPFLRTPKHAIADYLKQQRLASRIDESNLSEKYLRNWIRRQLVPLIESRVPEFKFRAGDLAEILREEQVCWDQQVQAAETSVCRPKGGGCLLDLEGLLRYPAAIQRRLLRRIAGRDLLTFVGVERLRDWMMAPPSNGRVFQLRKGWFVERLSKSKGSPTSKAFWFRPHQMAPETVSISRKKITKERPNK